MNERFTRSSSMMRTRIIVRRKPVLALLCLTLIARIFLYTDRLFVAPSSLSGGGFVEEVPTMSFGNDMSEMRAVSQESFPAVTEPVGMVYVDKLSRSDHGSTKSVDTLLGKYGEHKSRVLAETGLPLQQGEGLIEQVAGRREGIHSGENTEKEAEQFANTVQKEEENKPELRSLHGSLRIVSVKQSQSVTTEGALASVTDAKVRQLKDQLVRAKVYLSTSATRSNPPYIRELRARVRDIQKIVGDATKDSQLPKGASEKLKAMEQVLAKGKQIHDDCSDIVKKLRAIVQSTEEQLQAHQKQTLFLTQLAAKTLPKGLHCLPLLLSNEFFSLDPGSQQYPNQFFSLDPRGQQYPNQEILEDPDLYHYALFSDNVLAASVVVNSTVSNSKNPEKHVFHVVTDRLNYAAMKMWFLANPPGKATIQVQNVEEFTWLNSTYSPVLKQLGSQSMIDYYFKTNNANSDSNLKYRNPKYLSILNHLRFYLPEIFPKLSKVIFLDDDIVVQKDLTGLWTLDLKGKVNGAVETCGESFHRFDRYLNFSNPLIAKTFDPRACGWAFGMNVFDLAEWRRQNITEIYHSWQRMNEHRLLWKLGSLPPGLITFYNRVYPIDRSWHVLGLGYNPNVNIKAVEQAAVIHYNGNMKPWLEIGIPKYRSYWSKYVNYDQIFLRECNITP